MCKYDKYLYNTYNVPQKDSYRLFFAKEKWNLWVCIFNPRFYGYTQDLHTCTRKTRLKFPTELWDVTKLAVLVCLLLYIFYCFFLFLVIILNSCSHSEKNSKWNAWFSLIKSLSHFYHVTLYKYQKCITLITSTIFIGNITLQKLPKNVWEPNKQAPPLISLTLHCFTV